jgi:uncharacterized membrane protein
VELFTQGGGEMLSRWGHYLAGVTWIGLLYYFNFVQTPAFAQFEAGTRTEALAKLAPRALWWFRWGAALTLATGLSILAFQENYDMDYFKSPRGISIATGILLALFMFANVWLVIWPNQKVVIANAQNVMGGGEANPAAATSARKGAMASRTNTVFSIPMLFFMGATSHFAVLGFDTSQGSDRAVYYLVVLAIVLLLELNALGVFGTSVGGPRIYLETHRDAIITGFVLSAIFIVLYEGLFNLPG